MANFSSLSSNTLRVKKKWPHSVCFYYDNKIILGGKGTFFFVFLPSSDLLGHLVALVSSCSPIWLLNARVAESTFPTLSQCDLIHAVKLLDLWFYPRSLLWLKYLSQLLTRCYKVIKSTCQKLYSFFCVCVFDWFWCHRMRLEVFLPLQFFLKSLRRIGNIL